MWANTSRGGSSEPVWGTRWVMMLARGDTPHTRMILDVAWVQRQGTEAEVAMESIARVRPLTPGAQAVVYDMALRGTHKQVLLHEHGLLPIIRVPAKRAARETPKLCRVHAIDG